MSASKVESSSNDFRAQAASRCTGPRLVRVGFIILAAAVIDRLSRRGRDPADQEGSPQDVALQGDSVDIGTYRQKEAVEP